MNTLQNRKKNRLAKYDYSQPGYYFVTVCVKDRVCCLGEVVNGGVVLSVYGQIVEQFWKDIPNYYPNIKLDEFIIMPNHVHGIVIIEPVGAATGRPKNKAGNARPYTSLDTVVGSFKNISSKKIRIAGLANFFWQKSFYDHVIRKDESLDKIRQYISNNPASWDLDEQHPAFPN